jgi:hypothetical protein
MVANLAGFVHYVGWGATTVGASVLRIEPSNDDRNAGYRSWFVRFRVLSRRKMAR